MKEMGMVQAAMLPREVARVAQRLREEAGKLDRQAEMLRALAEQMEDAIDGG